MAHSSKKKRDRPEQFRFAGSDQPVTVIGERVVLFAPLEQPPLGEFYNITLDALVHYLIHKSEAVFIELMQQYGRGCSDFEITLREGQFGVIFTRPMNNMEQTQIRQHRLKKHAPRAPMSDEEHVPPPRPSLDSNRLPDPSLALDRRHRRHP